MLGLVIVIASALSDPVEFRWAAPEGCPSEDDVRARVEQYVGDAPAPESVRAEADVTEQSEGRWQLVLITTDASGASQTRALEDTDCEGLAETAAVLTALAVAPGAAAAPAPAPAPAPQASPTPRPEPAEPEPEPPARSESAAPVRPEARPERQAPPSQTATLRYGVRLAGGIGLGWLPLGGDLGVAATIGGRWWSAELEGLLGVPRRVRLERRPTAGANLLGWSVAARGCGSLPLAPWLSLPLCAGLEGGQVRAASVGLADAADAALPWLAALGSASLRATVHPRVALWLMPELQLGLRRPVFHASGQRDEVFASSLASGRVRAGLELVF